PAGQPPRRRRYQGASLKSLSTPYNSAHHRFAVFTACATFILIVAGALVTSNDAGLSIPDWPTSFGSFSVPPLHGGIRYEWSHRAIAGSTIILTLLSIFVLYVQLIVGAMFRHHGMSWWPHVLNAPVVAFVLAWTAIRALSLYSRIEAIRRPAVLILALLIAQLCLGFLAFLTRVAWGHDVIQPELPMVMSTVAHVAVGALLLATAVVLAIQVWRHVPVAFEERIPAGSRDPVAS